MNIKWISSILVLALIPLIADAQYGKFISIGLDGDMYFNTLLTPEQHGSLRSLLKMAPNDSHISVAKSCNALMEYLPSPFLGTLADIGSFIGVCDSSSEIAEQYIGKLHTEMGKFCQDLSGAYYTTFAVGGEWHPGLVVARCEYTPVKIEPTCSGMRDFCMKTKGAASLEAPRSDEPARLVGWLRLPGCNCKTGVRFLPAPIYSTPGSEQLTLE